MSMVLAIPLAVVSILVGGLLVAGFLSFCHEFSGGVLVAGMVGLTASMVLLVAFTIAGRADGDLPPWLGVLAMCSLLAMFFGAMADGDA